MYLSRIQKAQDLLNVYKVDAILLASPIDIYYFTGVSHFSREEREAYFLITQKRAYLFTDFRYIPGIKVTHGFTVKEISSKNRFSSLLQTTLTANRVKRLGFEGALTFHEVKILKKDIKIRWKEISEFSQNLRVFKENSEIINIQKACQLTDLTFKNIVRHVKSGVSEQELAFKIEVFIKNTGNDIAFSPIVAFASNSAIPHHKPSGKKLTKNSFVLFDFGAKVNEYCSDMTRTVVYGSASTKQQKIYNTVLDAQLQGIQNATPNVSLEKIHTIANSAITSKGFPHIPHSVGHGVGLEVHEMPTMRSKRFGNLTKNTVFTIEPGIYLPGYGGVRIEDTLLMNDSPEILTKSPKKLIEIL